MIPDPAAATQGGTTSEEDDEGYVTDPESNIGPDASSESERATDPDEAAHGEDETLTPDSVEEFRQRLARQESGAEADTSSRPAAAFGLEACLCAIGTFITPMHLGPVMLTFCWSHMGGLDAVLVVSFTSPLRGCSLMLRHTSVCAGLLRPNPKLYHETNRK